MRKGDQKSQQQIQERVLRGTLIHLSGADMHVLSPCEDEVLSLKEGNFSSSFSLFK